MDLLIQRIKQESQNNHLLYCEQNGIDFSSGHTTITMPKIKNKEVKK